MNAFEVSKEHLINGLKTAEEGGIDGRGYGQALLWNLLQYYRSIGRDEADIRNEVSFALDNLNDDDDFHVSRN